MEVIWKDIGFSEGRYQISNDGRVKSLSRKVNSRIGGRLVKERILKFRKLPTGYLYVAFNVSGKLKNSFVHRLVATAFIPNPENKPTVNHKNGDKEDNRIENLEWATQYENNLHGRTMGLIKGAKNESNPNSRKISQTNREGELVKMWPSFAEIGRGGFNRRNVSTAMKNDWFCSGYKWRYVS